jgi:hypothetical protein
MEIINFDFSYFRLIAARRAALFRTRHTKERKFLKQRIEGLAIIHAKINVLASLQKYNREVKNLK